MPALETRKLTKYYGRTTGIQDISLQVTEGSFLGLLGPRGAGKTTLFRLLLGLLYPSYGNASIFDLDCASGVFIRRMVGYAPDFFSAPRQMRIKNLLTLSGRFFGDGDYSRMQELCALLGLDSHARIGELSSSGKKKAGLVAAMAHDPKLLLLDEPTRGLDAIDVATVFDLLGEISRSGTTIIMATANVSDVRRYCSHAAILDAGTLLRYAPVTEIAALHAFRVAITIDENVYDLARHLSVRHFSSAGNTLSFTYDGSLDTLIKSLGRFTVHALQITEPALDTVIFSSRTRGEPADDEQA